MRTSPAPSPAAAPPANADDFADVTLSGEKTSAGGEVIAIGAPRFELVEARGFGPLVLRARRGAVFAEDAHWISIWDAATGTPLRHIAPRWNAWPAISTSLAVSADGEWLATGSSFQVRVFPRPFTQLAAELACYNARAISHDGKLLACTTTTLGVWDIAKHQLIVPFPANGPKDRANDARFAPDDRSLVWTTDRAVLRWKFASTGAVTPIYQAPARIDHVAIAESGSAAYVLSAGKAVVVDLATGKITTAIAQFGTTISPSGQRLAAGLPGSLQVTDLPTGTPVWTTKVTAPVSRIAFGETEDTLVYLEAHHLRVATIPGQPTVPPMPSRFAGWLGNGIAAIER